MSRALSVMDLLNKKEELFEFTGAWKDAFGCPEQHGIWFIWGGSGSGKTNFALQLVKHLATFTRVGYNSYEERSSYTMQESFRRHEMAEVSGRVILVEGESIPEMSKRLLKRRSPSVMVFDSFQYSQLTYKQYIKFKETHPNKLIIFISHAEGKMPAGRAAKSVMYDSDLKIYVEGYKAVSKGRYIGETGEYVIWKEGAEKYWGSKPINA